MPLPESPSVPCHLRLKMQEIPYDHPDSRWMFDKNFVSTRAAYHIFGPELLFAGLLRLQALASQHEGLDYLQVFKNLCKLEHDGKDLWFIEDGQVVTALLPEDY